MSLSPPAAAPRPRYWLHLGLLLATTTTTTFAGLLQFGSLRGALAYSLPLMATTKKPFKPMSHQ